MTQRRWSRQPEFEVLGQLILKAEDTAARTDIAPNGTVHVYQSGTSVFLGVYGGSLATPGWKYIELT